MIETIAGMVIGGVLVWYISWTLTKRSIKKLLSSEETAIALAKIIKKALKEYKNV